MTYQQQKGGVSFAMHRWNRDPGFYRNRIFRGRVADLGGAANPFADLRPAFPQVSEVVTVDICPTTTPGIIADLNTWEPEPESFECIIASHSLEHLHYPMGAFQRWEQGLRPGGHLLVIVPSWETYERKRWPAQVNPDHKTAWTIGGHGLSTMSEQAGFSHIRSVLWLPLYTEIVRLTTLDEGFKPNAEHDQILEGSCECAIELVTRRPHA